ncbi:MAG: DUF1080 domain-containing protein [Planctomycetes bacterium]|nr:DUF1080 domain-containing protein [Planctomycetota bacterium]
MRFAAILSIAALTVSALLAQPAGDAVLPVGADGKPLNLDFETGTLKDWTAEGDAFKLQPIKGDTVFPRRNDSKSQHQGQFWIGTYERFQDKPMGTLTSMPFKITHPWASFLVGGGPWPETCVELVRTDTGTVFFRVSGLEEENLRRVAVDLRQYLGKEMFIRLVDRHSGHWGHINFDDFRFHKAEPKVPPRPKHHLPQALDTIKFAGLPPKKAAAAMTVPDGFRVTLFAGEPDIHQPIAMCLDDRGRLWVAEGHVYPRRRPDKGPLLPEGQSGDRILIFEDTNSDGVFDKRTVFMDRLNLVSGIEVGFGGVWIGAAPYLMFVPAKDDRPAGPPQILLDGWGWHDTHETLNAFIWGPDGWLYGCHGVFTHSRVGKPGTPDDKRIPINAGVWRYHPTRHVFEVFAHGTSNPWGLDFNDMGQAFVSACVIPHAFHIIQGGRYHRQAGGHFNPHTYADIQTIADHLHWSGPNQWAANNRSGSFGGGHAHCGLMIYQGGTWPESYRDQLFMGNIHGRRINMDILKAKGSGYTASHGPDLLLANDAWARFINMRYGPDGNVYLIDWYDKQACHSGDTKIWDRSNGRLYKLSFRGTKKATPINLQLSTDAELVAHQLGKNEWHVRHARRILQERAAANKIDDKARRALSNIAFKHEDASRRLRGLWAVHAAGGHVQPGLQDKNESVRAWAIQLALAPSVLSVELVGKLVDLAANDPSPVVRLYLASAAQRIPPSDRWDLLTNLLSHSADAADQNLPLMYWYAAEPLAAIDPARALALVLNGKIPQLRGYMIRRIGAGGDAAGLLVDALARTPGAGEQLTFLDAIRAALKGRRQVTMPAAWPKLFDKLKDSDDARVRLQAVCLAVTFGNPGPALAMVKQRGNTANQAAAISALLDAGHPKLTPELHWLLDSELKGTQVRRLALRGLAAYDDPATPHEILRRFPGYTAEERIDALNTLAARPRFARALLEAIGTKQIASKDVSAEIVRQLRNLNDKDVSARIAEVWGIVRDTPAERAKVMAQYRKLLTSPAKKTPDVVLGRSLYSKTCAQCHSLFGVGGKVGPDITGSNRANLDYLLENLLDPSAVIPKEYAASIVELASGRFITGIVKEQTGTAVTVATANEVLTLPRGEIDAIKATPQSMMPDDQLKPLSEHEVRSLIAYLQSPVQVPLRATRDNVKDFFNGKDLAGWDGDPKLWKVDNGEIVGRSPGIKHNEFLRSHMSVGDFKLSLKVKLVPDAGNSGIQFRSEVLPGGDVKGPQADIGAGWWGKLYEEHGRGILWDKSGEPHVKPGAWNDYVIEARGSQVRTWINGQPGVNIDDGKLSRRGIIALQIHEGPAMEVRFKELRLEVIGE